jgi:hypothetical protein
MAPTMPAALVAALGVVARAPTASVALGVNAGGAEKLDHHMCVHISTDESACSFQRGARVGDEAS